MCVSGCCSTCWRLAAVVVWPASAVPVCLDIASPVVVVVGGGDVVV